jgi:hypothetical protein
MSPNTQIALLSGLALVLIGLGIWIIARVVKATPEKKEQKRRLWVNANGRLGDALITETTDTTLYYAYSIHGVRYTTSQDLPILSTPYGIQPTPSCFARNGAAFGFMEREPCRQLLHFNRKRHQTHNTALRQRVHRDFTKQGVDLLIHECRFQADIVVIAI